MYCPVPYMNLTMFICAGGGGVCLYQAATSRSSRETITEVTKTAIHRLAARGWLQKGINPMLKRPNLQQNFF